VKPFAEAPRIVAPVAEAKPVALTNGSGAEAHEDLAF
jgi:hypothetical protein